MRYAARLLIAFLLWAPAALAQDRGAQDASLARRLDAVLERAIAEQRVVGAVVLVARDGAVVYHRAIGSADREAGTPVREDTIFRLASMSKPIVSAAALALVDQGRLGLDDPVTRWIPDFRPRLADGSEPAITVRQLMTHTAGLNYGFLEPPDGPYHRAGVSDGIDRSVASIGENLRRIAAAPLLFPPGTQWHYSLATDVLGEVVARAGGAPLPEVVRRTVTGPLGMADTGFAPVDPARLAVPYADASPQPLRMPDPHSQSFGPSAIVYSPGRALDSTMYPSAGAGMVGTAADYLRLLEALRTGGAPILAAATAQAMTRNAIGDIAGPSGSTATGFGLGVAVLRSTGPNGPPFAVGTWNWGGVYGSNFWVDPDARISAVVLTNTAITGMIGAFPAQIVAAVYTRE
jgi:CubicO group peptidase (beta-lactamase class C family)